ncbi:DUF4843 domain-containing protein [Flavobacterium marginilacus]|uniref:DUF4843 domain-containing protein n=1 Tax=Flavobacterium marginilacus TaxID=3003256 RepID=UPI00248F2A25|nr:DUF4843 domain-containing protein [Flavobacterium marginilacus]
MNKILILSIVFFSFLGLTSCTQEEIKAYEDTDNIYFSRSIFPLYSSGPVIDSTGFSFGFDNAAIKERIFPLAIRVQGKVSNVDRKVNLTVDPSSTAVLGTHFTLPENIVLRAGKEIDTILVKVLRTSDMKTKDLTLVLNLEDNDFFTTKMKSRVTNVLTGKTISFVRFKLSFNDKLSAPVSWSTANYGVFSAKKLFLMCDLMDLQPEMFNLPQGSIGLTIPDVQYYQNFMRRYLADQKASGNTIYEDNGNEMFFP